MQLITITQGHRLCADTHFELNNLSDFYLVPYEDMILPFRIIGYAL